MVNVLKWARYRKKPKNVTFQLCYPPCAGLPGCQRQPSTGAGEPAVDDAAYPLKIDILF